MVGETQVQPSPEMTSTTTPSPTPTPVRLPNLEVEVISPPESALDPHLPADVPINILQIRIFTAKDGWAIDRLEYGNMLLSTSGGGQTWERLHPLTALDDAV